MIKKISLDKISFFPETCTCSKNKIKVWLDLSNYAIKSNWKSAAGGDTSKSGGKTDLASLKSDIDKLNIEKLEEVPSGLNSFTSKVDELDVTLMTLSNVVEKEAVKKTVYDELVYKVNTITTSGIN